MSLHVNDNSNEFRILMLPSLTLEAFDVFEKGFALNMCLSVHHLSFSDLPAPIPPSSWGIHDVFLKVLNLTVFFVSVCFMGKACLLLISLGWSSQTIMKMCCFNISSLLLYFYMFDFHIRLFLDFLFTHSIFVSLTKQIEEFSFL